MQIKFVKSYTGTETDNVSRNPGELLDTYPDRAMWLIASGYAEAVIDDAPFTPPLEPPKRTGRTKK